jgi:hypothetical protein
MRRPAFVWAGALGGLAVLDLWCARNAVVGDSLSEVTRATLRTHTRLGKATFVGFWTGLTVWLVPHIIRAIDDNLADFDA